MVALNKIKIIKNFLSNDEIKLLTHYTRIKHRLNFTDFDTRQSNQGDTMQYGDPVTDALLVSKHKLMEKETNLKLLPTYSFWRMYVYNSELVKHKDRPSCEVSVTVKISSCGTQWPIFMGGEEVSLEDGDAVIYPGCEIEHWRNPFHGDWASQVFLHYVNANGPHKEWYLDKRPLFGAEKNI